MLYALCITLKILLVTVAVVSIVLASLSNDIGHDAIHTYIIRYIPLFRGNAAGENGDALNILFLRNRFAFNSDNDGSMPSQQLLLVGKNYSHMSKINDGNDFMESESEILHSFAIDSITGLKNGGGRNNTSLGEKIRDDALTFQLDHQSKTSTLILSQSSSDTASIAVNSRKLFVLPDNYNDDDAHEFVEFLSSHKELADEEKLFLCVNIFLPPSNNCGHFGGKGSKPKSGSKSSKFKGSKSYYGSGGTSKTKSGGKSNKAKGASKGHHGKGGNSKSKSGGNLNEAKGDFFIPSNYYYYDTDGKGSKFKSGGKSSKGKGTFLLPPKDYYGYGGKGSKSKSGTKSSKTKGSYLLLSKGNYGFGGKGSKSKSGSKSYKAKGYYGSGAKASHSKFGGKSTNAFDRRQSKNKKATGKTGKYWEYAYIGKGVEYTKGNGKGYSKSGKKEKDYARLLSTQGRSPDYVCEIRTLSNTSRKNQTSGIETNILLEIYRPFTSQNISFALDDSNF